MHCQSILHHRPRDESSLTRGKRSLPARPSFCRFVIDEGSARRLKRANFQRGVDGLLVVVVLSHRRHPAPENWTTPSNPAGRIFMTNLDALESHEARRSSRRVQPNPSSWPSPVAGIVGRRRRAPTSSSITTPRRLTMTCSTSSKARSFLASLASSCVSACHDGRTVLRHHLFHADD